VWAVDCINIRVIVIVDDISGSCDEDNNGDKDKGSGNKGACRNKITERCRKTGDNRIDRAGNGKITMEGHDAINYLTGILLNYPGKSANC
jgi:hypothetical protein